MEGHLCIVCDGVLLEWWRGKGRSIWGGKRSSGFPISGFCFLLMREIWAQQGYEQEALRVYGKTDSGEDKGFGVKIVVDIVGSGLFLLSPGPVPSHYHSVAVTVV